MAKEVSDSREMSGFTENPSEYSLGISLRVTLEPSSDS